ncbi:LMBR1-like conserved region family protein [Cryptosporidium felis]|nr:LMBR1-like conserved region family protein [Cryptosporidium felis]
MVLLIVTFFGLLTINFLVWRYIGEIASDDVNPLTAFSCYLGITISISPIVLLPLDITNSLLLGTQVNYFNYNLKNFWKAAYFMLFILCWVIYPILIEYELSGGFDSRSKLRASLKRNKKHWTLQIIAIFISSLSYYIFIKTPDSKFSITTICILAAHYWGMTQITFLWGFGLAVIPNYIKNSIKTKYDYKSINDLNRCYSLLDNLEEYKAVNIHEINSVNYQLNYLFSITNDEFLKNIIGEMIKKINNENRISIGKDSNGRKSIPSILTSHKKVERDTYCLEDLIELNRELKLLISEERRIQHQLRLVLNKCWKLEDEFEISFNQNDDDHMPLMFDLNNLLQMKIQKKNPTDDTIQVIDSKLHRKMSEKCNLVFEISSNNYYEVFYYFPKLLKKLSSEIIQNTHFKSVFYALTLFTSLNIVIAEATIYFPNVNIFFYSHILKICSRISHWNYYLGAILIYAICLYLLIYLYICTFCGLFYFKIPKKYGIYFDKQTDGSCIVFFSQFLSKLSAALCFHYLSILKIEKTSFGAFYSRKMQYLPIFVGKNFNLFIFPMLVVLNYIINIFELQEKLMKNSGIYFLFFDYYVFDEHSLGLDREIDSHEKIERISNGKRISEIQRMKI